MIYLRGILVGFAFVAPIGMQNIYMFNNALSNKMSKALLYNFLVWFCDALFSFAAFYGIGALISANEIVKIIVMPENTRHHWLKNIRSQMRSLKSSPSDTG